MFLAHHLIHNGIIFYGMNIVILPVSESSGGHDPLFRKGVRRGVKARFQNVFDVGGFYVECESEGAADEITMNENNTSMSNDDGAEEIEIEEGGDGEDTARKSRVRTNARTPRKPVVTQAQALNIIDSMQKD